MGRTNTSSHFEVTTSNGETFTEKCRNSLGGWANLADRVAKRLGGERLHPVQVDETHSVWSCNGQQVTFVPVNVL